MPDEGCPAPRSTLAAVGGGGGNDDGGGAQQGGAGPSLADCHVGSGDCADACQLIDCCASDRKLLAECMTRCEASTWVEGHALRCLALRIFWIDEAGCERIVETYEAFQSNDDCTGEMR